MVKIGSVISGTLRMEDLFKTFVEFLENYGGVKSKYTVHKAQWFIENNDYDSESFVEIADDVWEELNKIAPEGCYFGAHEGDGSDFGFWPFSEEEIDWMNFGDK